MSVPLINEGELQLVRDSALIPVLLDVLHGDLRQLNETPLRLAPVITQSLRQCEAEAIRELTTLKYELRQRGIQIYEERRTSARLEVRYKCRGYDHQLKLLWPFAQAEMIKKVSDYMQLKWNNRKDSHA